MARRTAYALIIEPISDDDGGGYMASFPDLPGCMSDGENPEEAVANALEAFEAWMEVQEERGAYIPQPGESRLDGVNQVLGGLSASVDAIEEKLEDLAARINRLEKTAEIEASVSRSWTRRRAFSSGGTARFSLSQKSLVG